MDEPEVAAPVPGSSPRSPDHPPIGWRKYRFGKHLVLIVLFAAVLVFPAYAVLRRWLGLDHKEALDVLAVSKETLLWGVTFAGTLFGLTNVAGKFAPPGKDP